MERMTFIFPAGEFSCQGTYEEKDNILKTKFSNKAGGNEIWTEIMTDFYDYWNNGNKDMESHSGKIIVAKWRYRGCSATAFYFGDLDSNSSDVFDLETHWRFNTKQESQEAVEENQ